MENNTIRNELIRTTTLINNENGSNERKLSCSEIGNAELDIPNWLSRKTNAITIPIKKIICSSFKEI